MTKEAEMLATAAQAVVDQWDTPNWKLIESTAALISNLRAALRAAARPAPAAGVIDREAVEELNEAHEALTAIGVSRCEEGCPLTLAARLALLMPTMAGEPVSTKRLREMIRDGYPVVEIYAQCDLIDAALNPTMAGEPVASEVDRIMSMSDDEILADARSQGLDPEKIAADGRAALERIIAVVDAKPINAMRNMLERCRVILANMAMENEGAIFKRWPINHEPLRADARNILSDIDEVLECSLYASTAPSGRDRATIEAAADIANSWQKPSVIKLAAGEMTAQELRTARAVAGGIEAAIRSLIPQRT